jgi:antitoxin YobK
MSIDDYEAALHLVQEHPELAEFVGPRDELVIRAAEQALGISFPPTYRRYLAELGAGNFGSSEIYGVIEADFAESGIPDGIWYTLRQRREHGLPERLVIIASNEYGPLLCLDLGATPAGAEAPVVLYDGEISAGEPQTETVAQDFGTFFLQEVKVQL